MSELQVANPHDRTFRARARRFSGWREWTAEEFVFDSAHVVSAGIDGMLSSYSRRHAFGSTRRAPGPLHYAGLSPAELARTSAAQPA